MLRTLLLSIGGFVVSLGLAFLFSAHYFPLTLQTVNLYEGEALFQQRCSGCHSISRESQQKMGPNLALIGSEGATRREGMSSVAYILESITQPDAFRVANSSENMPSDAVDGLSVDSIRNLVAFVASQGARPDMREMVNLKIDISQHDEGEAERLPVVLIKQGKDLFYGKYYCVSCHSYYPDPGHDLFAPSLTRAGQLRESYIRESIREPSASIAAGYQQASVRLRDGRLLTGRILSEQDSRLALMMINAAGDYEQVQLNADDIDTINRSPISLMPPYTMTPAEEDAIVAFLKFLKLADG